MFGHSVLDSLIESHRAWLSREGELVVGSGTFEASPFAGSLYTCYGPPEQDKCPENQDFALAWLRPDATSGLRLVIAIADGLTSSFRSDWASALGCWTAARLLAQNYAEDVHPRQLGLAVFAAVGTALGQLAQAMADAPEASCPRDQYLSTWKYILKKGLLLQTTLTLAWLDHEMLRVAMVGDGGILLRHFQPRPADHVLAQCDLTTNLVNALGPGNLGPLDEWVERPIAGAFRCALMTDGLVRGLGANPMGLLDELEQMEALAAPNLAQAYVDRVVRERPGEFADNLTLVLLEGK